MKKRKSNKKEVSKTKVKKTKNSITGRQLGKTKEQSLGKVISLKLKPIVKAYDNFIEKRKVKKLKEEKVKQKEQEEQRLKE